MANIKDIEGIGPAYATKLATAGVKTTDKLLDVAASKAGRKKLAEETSLSESNILEWVNRADLFRVKGIAEEISDLLEFSGVDSVPELATRNAENLHAKMTEVNDAKKLVRKVPSLGQVENFIAEAKTLPKVVTH